MMQRSKQLQRKRSFSNRGTNDDDSDDNSPSKKSIQTVLHTFGKALIDLSKSIKRSDDDDDDVSDDNSDDDQDDDEKNKNQSDCCCSESSSWNEISITFASVTDPDAARILYDALQKSGYGPPATATGPTERSTISKGKANAAIGTTLDIVQIDSSGTPIEKFKLHNPFFTEVTFGGSLDYEQEGIVDLTCKVKYDYAELDSATKVKGVTGRDGTAIYRPSGVRPLSDVGQEE
jgi:hypothetical protein